MSAIRFLPLVALLFACGGNDGGDDSGGSSAIEDGRFSEFIFVDREGVSVTGDFTGLPDGGNVWADTPWLTQTVIAAGDLSVEATVEDFQEDTLEPDRSVDLWFVDAVTATPDQSTVSDVNGAVSMAAKSCQMMVYRVDGDPSRAKRTYKGHHSYSPEADGVIDDALFVSVSDITYKLIPSLLGLTVDVDKAIIAGTAYDIMRDAGLPSDVDLGKIEGAQVIVYDENGKVPDTVSIHYFTESFPDRDQQWTSEDGLWIAANVPPGVLRVELYGVVGGELKLLGATLVDSEADSINVSNVYSGYGDGVKYGNACEVGAGTTGTTTTGTTTTGTTTISTTGTMPT